MTPEEIAAAAAAKATADAAAAKAAEEATAAKAASDAAEAAAKAAAEAEAKKKASTLTDAEARLLKENMEKKEALRLANDKLKAFEGLDAVEIRKIIDDKKAADLEAAARAGEWEKVKKQMADAQDLVVKAKDTVIAEKDTTLASMQKQVADLTVGNAFAHSKFIGEKLALTPAKVRILLGSHFEYVDGKVVGYDLPLGTKDRAPLVDKSGNTLTFDEAIAKIVDADPEKDSILRSTVASGASSGTLTGAAATAAAAAAAAASKTDGPKGIDRLSAALEKESKEKAAAKK